MPRLPPAEPDRSAVDGDSGSWRAMEGKIQVYIEQHHDLQQTMARMFHDQLMALRDMKEYVEHHQQQLAKNPNDPETTIVSITEKQPSSMPTKGIDMASTKGKGIDVASMPIDHGDEPKHDNSGNLSDLGVDMDSLEGHKHHDFSALDLKGIGPQCLPGEVDYKELPLLQEHPIMFLKVLGARVLFWRFFEPLMGIFILLNAVNIGWTLDLELRCEHIDVSECTAIPRVLEHILLGVFTAELLLRLFVRGIHAMMNPWNVMDLVLILANYFEMVVNLILSVTGGDRYGRNFAWLSQLLVLRTLRIIRLARAVRLVRTCKSLWKLVQGLVQCFGTMVSATFLMICFLFLFACFGAELITKVYRDDPVIGPDIRVRFGTMPRILLTLFQFISLDSVSAFYIPLIFHQPWLAIYFLLLLVTVSIALLNLVTALLVEDAISTQRDDDEMEAFYTRQKLKDLQPLFRELFRNLDVSNDGILRVHEILESMHKGFEIPKPLQDIINHARIIDLFDALDKDQSGTVTEEEFVEGLGYMALSHMPLETLQILHLVRSCTGEVMKLRKDMRSYMSNKNLKHWIEHNDSPDKPDGQDADDWEPISARGVVPFRAMTSSSLHTR